MLSLQEVEDAAQVVYAAMPPTAQYAWPLLARRTGCEVWVKHENHTPIGAFKVRGGLVYMDRLKHTQPDLKGVISATRGNHGQSIAVGAAKVGIRRHHRRAAGQFGGKERRHARLRGGAGRGRPRLRCRARCRPAAGERARAGDDPVVPPRPGARRGDLCAGAVPRRAAARHGLCADRPGLGHLRRDRHARCHEPRDQGGGRGVDRGAGLCAVVCRRQGRADQQRRHHGRRHGRARSRCRGAQHHPEGRRPHRAGERRRDRRGHARLLRGHASAHRRRRRGSRSPP